MNNDRKGQEMRSYEIYSIEYKTMNKKKRIKREKDIEEN